MIPTQSQIRDAQSDFEQAEDHWASGENFVPMATTCKVVRSILQSALDTQKPAGDVATFEKWLDSRHISAEKKPNAWNMEVYAHSHVQAMWEGWSAALNGDCGGGDLEADTKKVIHLLDNGWKPVFNPPYEDTKYTLNKLPEGIISSAGFEKLSFEDAVTVQRCLEKVALTADNAKRGE